MFAHGQWGHDGCAAVTVASVGDADAFCIVLFSACRWRLR
jgi:hypothetical protein